MRIVFDGRESGTTSGRYVDKLLENLMQIDRENDYMLLLKKHRLAAYNDLPKNFRAIECNIKEFTFGEQLKLPFIIRRQKPDLVHFPFVQQPIFYFGRAVTTMQDLTTLRFTNPTKQRLKFWVMQRAYWLVNMIAIRKSKAILTPTEFVKHDIQKTLHHHRPEKITVTLESADAISAMPEEVRELVGKDYIMYVGRHQPHKNLERLIDAFALIQKSRPKLYLAIVGKPDATTELLAKKYAHVAQIVYTGFVSEGQLRWLYERTQAYVFPSLSEGFGLPPLEAMHHGAPVVASNASCIPEVCGEAALYFSPYSVKDMAMAILDVLNNKRLKVALIQKGKKRVGQFSWRRMAAQTLDVYKQVLGK
jgi:glycosyltransferase involved in cell wall biosynthesis